MDKLTFSFARHGHLYYQSATHMVIKNQHYSASTARVYSGPGVSCLATGCSIDSYFMNADGTLRFKNLPSSLESWLRRSEENGCRTTCTTKVALGPNDSFFAWDDISMRWANLPPGLEEKLQSWLGPKGWEHGPPTVVTLGYGGSYYIGTSDGSYSVYVPPEQAEMARKWEHINNTTKIGDLQYVSFNPFRENEFVAIRKDGTYDYIVPDPLQCFLDVADSISDPGRVNDRLADRKALAEAEREQKARKLREQEAEKKRETGEGADQEQGEENTRKAKTEEEAGQKQAEEESQKKYADEGRKRQAEEDIRKQKADKETRKAKANEEAEKREQENAFCQQQYTTWKKSCNECFSSDAPIIAFPHIPICMCTCANISCTSRNTEGSLMACRHDVGRLLRGSGQYSYSWLKTESYPWHPDRFGRKCHPDFKEALIKKATELFAVFGELLEEAKC